MIPDNARRKNIISSAFDYQWFDKIQVKSKVFFMMCGVLYYFEEEQVKEFLVKIAQRFPGGQIIFDTASPAGIKVLNKSVIKGVGMNENSFLKWGLKQAKAIEKWSAKIEIIEEYPYYANLPKQNYLEHNIQRYHVFEFNLNKGSESFVGNAWLDSDTGAPVQIKFKPVPMKSFVSKMVIIIQYEYTSNGLWYPKKVNTEFSVGFMFINKNMRINMDLSNYWMKKK